MSTQLLEPPRRNHTDGEGDSFFHRNCLAACVIITLPLCPCRLIVVYTQKIHVVNNEHGEIKPPYFKEILDYSRVQLFRCCTVTDTLINDVFPPVFTNY